MSSQKVTIIIPTRNRHDVLKHTLRTCLMQDYDNLSIVVSDNCSAPETQQAVSEISDSRVRYQRSPTRLSMMDSWEFALSGVSGEGLVHVMGDDNGIVPGTVRNVVRVTHETGLKIVHGAPIQYVWPSSGSSSGYVEVPAPRDGFIVKSSAALKNAYKMRIGFDRLPTIYASFVHSSVIKEARHMSGGRYFAAANPDVYSAAVNAMCVESYVYLNTPFFVNGGSSHSTGNAADTPGKSTFHMDNLDGGYRYHKDFGTSSVYSFNIAEAFAVAADIAFAATGRRYRLDLGRILKLAVKEYVTMNRPWLKDEIRQFAALHGLPLNLPELPPRNSPNTTRRDAVPCIRSGDKLVFASEFARLDDVLQASDFAGALLRSAPVGASVFRRPLKSRVRSFVLEHLAMGHRGSVR